jgi:4-hydroxy-3-methylbut-2-en-1-yl diphosphate synthase IspG/GcpE
MTTTTNCHNMRSAMAVENKNKKLFLFSKNKNGETNMNKIENANTHRKVASEKCKERFFALTSIAKETKKEAWLRIGVANGTLDEQVNEHWRDA